MRASKYDGLKLIQHEDHHDQPDTHVTSQTLTPAASQTAATSALSPFVIPAGAQSPGLGPMKRRTDSRTPQPPPSPMVHSLSRNQKRMSRRRSGRPTQDTILELKPAVTFNPDVYATQAPQPSAQSGLALVRNQLRGERYAYMTKPLAQRLRTRVRTHTVTHRWQYQAAVSYRHLAGHVTASLRGHARTLAGHDQQGA